MGWGHAPVAVHNLMRCTAAAATAVSAAAINEVADIVIAAALASLVVAAVSFVVAGTVANIRQTRR